MLNTFPRSTFHHTVLSGELLPISCALIHVNVFPSTAKLAAYLPEPKYMRDCVASLLYDKSSVTKNQIYISIYTCNCISLSIKK